MSKFEDLCNSFEKSRNTYFEYRDESFGFAGELISQYVQYLEIPKEQFKFIPLDEQPAPNTTYSLFGATHLNDDTFWHLGLQITLFSDPNTYPHQPILIRFMFKKSKKDIFVVKISEDDEGHLIERGNSPQYVKFFEFLQKQIRSNFEDGLQEFLEQSAPLRTIGFMQNDV